MSDSVRERSASGPINSCKSAYRLHLTTMAEFASSQVVKIAKEVLVVVQLSQVNVLLLLDGAMAVKAVVIFCDLVSILARSRNLDRARPVGVGIAQ